MNTTRIVAVATLTLTGFAAAQADEVVPAWRTDGFIMEEIVVTAKAPDYSFIDEIVVTVTVPQIETALVAREAPEVEVMPAPMMEELVVTAKAPASYDMEEIVVTAEAPDNSFIGEIVVSVTAPQFDEATVAALEAPEVEVTPVPVIEEIVATTRSDDHPSRLAARLRNL